MVPAVVFLTAGFVRTLSTVASLRDCLGYPLSEASSALPHCPDAVMDAKVWMGADKKSAAEIAQGRVRIARSVLLAQTEASCTRFFEETRFCADDL